MCILVFALSVGLGTHRASNADLESRHKRKSEGLDYKQYSPRLPWNASNMHMDRPILAIRLGYMQYSITVQSYFQSKGWIGVSTLLVESCLNFRSDLVGRAINLVVENLEH